MSAASRTIANGNADRFEKGGGVGFRLPVAVGAGVGWLRRFAATAPGAIGGVAVLTIALCLVTGLVGANQLGDKLTQRDTLLNRTEPLADAAQRLYVALSAADATAATAFLSAGIEPADVRAHYQQSLADAAAALADATAGADDAMTRQVLARIAADLPAYTGMVEAARANNRQGYPVGSAYLHEASTLMQNSLLPNAERLTGARFAAVRDQERALTGPPLLTVALLLLTLLACLACSLILLRRTNRRVNLGVLAAACAVLLAGLWVTGAGLAASATVDTGPGGATNRFDNLSRARILAQQARSDETQELVTRGEITAIEDKYKAHSDELRALLTSSLAKDSTAWPEFNGWVESHGKQVAAYQAANYPAAVEQAIGGGRDASASRFTHLDSALQTNITQIRGDVRDDVDTGGGFFLVGPEGALVLLLVAAGAVAAGIWPRLEEYL